MVLLDAHAYKYDHDLIFLSRKMFIGGLSWQTTPGNYAKQSLLWILINLSKVVRHYFWIRTLNKAYEIQILRPKSLVIVLSWPLIGCWANQRTAENNLK